MKQIALLIAIVGLLFIGSLKETAARGASSSSISSSSRSSSISSSSRSSSVPSSSRSTSVSRSSGGKSVSRSSFSGGKRSSGSFGSKTGKTVKAKKVGSKKVKTGKVKKAGGKKGKKGKTKIAGGGKVKIGKAKKSFDDDDYEYIEDYTFFEEDFPDNVFLEDDGVDFDTSLQKPQNRPKSRDIELDVNKSCILHSQLLGGLFGAALLLIVV